MWKWGSRSFSLHATPAVVIDTINRTPGPTLVRMKYLCTCHVRSHISFSVNVSSSAAASATLTGRSLRHGGRPDRCSRGIFRRQRGVNLVDNSSTVSGRILLIWRSKPDRCPRLCAESGKFELHARVAQPPEGRRASKAS